MFNLKNLISKNSYKKNIENNSVEFEEMSKFYNMLVKYKKLHPYFNLREVMLKLYPNLNWKQIISNSKFKS